MVCGFGGVRWKFHLKHAFSRERFRPFLESCDQWDEEVPEVEGDPVTENTNVLRYVNRALLERYDGLVLHAGALAYGGKAYLFVALPGTGKTTHMRLWLQNVPEAAILCGDKPIVRLENGRATVYASPWQGKENYGFPGSYPLGGIYLLHRGNTDRVEPASVQDALRVLLDATFFAELPRLRPRILGLLDGLCRAAPVAKLYCTISADAVEAVRSHMKKGGMKP